MKKLFSRINKKELGLGSLCLLIGAVLVGTCVSKPVKADEKTENFNVNEPEEEEDDFVVDDDDFEI